MINKLVSKQSLLPSCTGKTVLLNKVPELTVAHLIDPILKDKTDQAITRPKILEIKTELGHI